MDVLRRRKPGIVTDRPKPATHMLRARRRKASCRRGKAARWQNRDSNWPRGYLTQRDRAALIEHNNIADIDADYGDCSLTCVSMALLAGGAGARPDHPTTGRAASIVRSLRGQVRERRRSTARAKLLAELGF